MSLTRRQVGPAHDDEKSAEPARSTEPWWTYRDYLLRPVEGARAHGARPVLATSVERRRPPRDVVRLYDVDITWPVSDS